MESKLAAVRATITQIQQDPMQLNQLRPCILQMSELTSYKQRTKAADLILGLFKSYMESGIFGFEESVDEVEKYLLTCYLNLQEWSFGLLEMEEGRAIGDAALIALRILKLKLKGEVWTSDELGQWVSLLLLKKAIGLKVLGSKATEFADLALAAAYHAPKEMAVQGIDITVELLSRLPKVLPEGYFFAAKYTSKSLKRPRAENFDPSLQASRVEVLDSSDSLYRHLLSQAWLAVVSAPLSVSSCRRLLKKLPSKVIPNLADPKCLSGFLITCFELDASLAVLALHGLFLLITAHGLELKEYYTKLYTLLHEISDALDYHPNLLRLTELSLSSTALPAALIASFVRFFLRLALTSSLTVSRWTLGFAINCFRTHPTLTNMLHNAQTVDGFIDSELDPLKTNAHTSSLWELPLLMQHYDSSVRSLAKELTKAPETMKKVKLDAVEEPSLKVANPSVKAWPYNS